MFAFNEREGLSLLFDNEATIRKKYCNVRKILNGVAYGIAVFDGDYDAMENNPCGENKNFRRLQLIRKLLDYVKKAENQHYPNDCWTVS
ncbi:hypothetical protein V5799_004890 [Amblyomma americanum]|uniref:Uncharacterized protein n=1 Tax=Amblyomma americanum TaxID=6943 RepID=A0AAQ4D4T3_AMBAM